MNTPDGVAVGAQPTRGLRSPAADVRRELVELIPPLATKPFSSLRSSP
jgi:hypothetical protein